MTRPAALKQAPKIPPEADGRAILLNSVSEAEWQRQVITWAHRAGYRVHHVHDSRAQEWGTDSGVPDLILAQEGKVLWLPELKTQRGRVTLQQTAWLNAIRQSVGWAAPVWRPGDEAAVKAALGLSR